MRLYCTPPLTLWLPLSQLIVSPISSVGVVRLGGAVAVVAPVRP